MGSAEPTVVAEVWPRLLDEARRGSTPAIGALLEAARPFLTGLAAHELDSGVRGKEAVSDLVQKSMMEAACGFPAFKGTTEAELRVWLKNTLMNNLRDLLDKYQTEKRRLDREMRLDGATSAGGTVAVDDGESPSQLAVRNEEADALKRAIEKLSAEQREVIRLRNQEHLTFGEIGAKLGVSDMVAQKRWARAIEELRDLMEP